MNTKVIEGVIVTQEFNGKININTYKEFEELAISICNMIREETDFDCNYIIGDCDYEFKIEIL